MHRRRKAEGFNLALLDIMACGLGAIVLVFMVVKHNVSKPTAETGLLAADVKRLELQQEELRQSLDQVRSVKLNKLQSLKQSVLGSISCLPKKIESCWKEENR